MSKIDAFMKKHESNRGTYIGLARIYQWEEYFDKSENIIELGLKKFKNDSTLISIKAKNLINIGKTDDAIELLEKHNPNENIEIAIHIYDIHFKNKDYDKALDVIHNIYLKINVFVFFINSIKSPFCKFIQVSWMKSFFH